MNEKMRELGAKRSVIRELFEYGKERAALLGEECVFDFSLGNPSVATPTEVTDALVTLLREGDPVSLHGYTSAQGDLSVRRAIAKYLNDTYDAGADENLIYMTAGAAASLTCILTAIAEEGDEIIVNAPYFPEYRVFIERTGAVCREVMTNPDTFEPDIEALGAAITERTVAVIINSPNNPTGAVISEETILALSALLYEKQRELGHPIYLISDEPYRELVYTDIPLPYLTRYYDNTVVCYSYSKSLSLPGERIGFVLLSSTMENKERVYQAVMGAGRALGFVCAPSLFQHLIPRVLGKHTDIEIYRQNRDTLLGALTEYGFRAKRPDGAFYLFLEAPNGDAEAFSEMAKALGLLLVPSDSFGIPGYVRISYCVKPEMLARALPAFSALAHECRKRGLMDQRKDRSSK